MAYSCEIEHFDGTYVDKLRVILRSPVLRGVYVLITDIGRRRPLKLAYTRVNWVMLVNMCTQNKTPVYVLVIYFKV